MTVPDPIVVDPGELPLDVPAEGDGDDRPNDLPNGEEKP